MECRSDDELATPFQGHLGLSERFVAQIMLLLIMNTCIYHDVDVRNTVGIIFCQCVRYLIVIHTVPREEV